MDHELRPMTVRLGFFKGSAYPHRINGTEGAGSDGMGAVTAEALGSHSDTYPESSCIRCSSRMTAL